MRQGVVERLALLGRRRADRFHFLVDLHLGQTIRFLDELAVRRLLVRHRALVFGRILTVEALGLVHLEFGQRRFGLVLGGRVALGAPRFEAQIGLFGGGLGLAQRDRVFVELLLRLLAFFLRLQRRQFLPVGLDDRALGGEFVARPLDLGFERGDLGLIARRAARVFPFLLLLLVLERAQRRLGLFALLGRQFDALDVGGFLLAPSRVHPAVIALVAADRPGDLRGVAGLRGGGHVGRQAPVIVGHRSQRGARLIGELAPGFADLFGRLRGEFGGAPGEIALGVLARRRVALLHRAHLPRGVRHGVGAVADAPGVDVPIGLALKALEMADEIGRRAADRHRSEALPRPDAPAGGGNAAEHFLQRLDLLRQFVDRRRPRL